jgi:uncharacterized protein (UPF0335 family)
MSASDSAKSRMERVLRLHEQIDALKLDIRQVYAEEKADGGDKTAMGAAISYIRKREKDSTALADREAMADVYVAAYDAPRTHTHAREASYSETKGRGVDAAFVNSILVGGELTDNQEQIGGNGTDLPVEAATEKQAAGTSRPTNSNSPDDLIPVEANSAGGAPSSSPASPARHSDDIDLTIPDFLRRTEGGYPKREAEAI